MNRILSIGTAVPPYGIDQLSILDFMKAAYKNDQVARKLGFLFRQSGISKRHSVVPDFCRAQQERTLFKEDQVHPNIETRMEIFKKQAPLLCLEAVNAAFSKLNISAKEFGITHLITVSCTGITSPGIDSELSERLQLPNDISRFPVNFVGCNAAFPALKTADMIIQSEKNAKVLVVCVELCTLHFQPKDNSDNLLSNTLFGDGAAAAIVTSESYAAQNRIGGLGMRGFYSLLLGKGKSLMGWNVTPLSFEMNLHASVSDFIGEEIEKIIVKAENKLDFKVADIDRWAVHPGGKRILDRIGKQLGLGNGELQYSYKILESYGNMSSPTILFVLNEAWKARLRPNEQILSLGFGPGLSVETALFAYAA
jgi:predicted naringenin-chalcone synthase